MYKSARARIGLSELYSEVAQAKIENKKSSDPDPNIPTPRADSYMQNSHLTLHFFKKRQSFPPLLNQKKGVVSPPAPYVLYINDDQFYLSKRWWFNSTSHLDPRNYEKPRI